MLKVGLTGGIGCGKSTVCRLFADKGVPVIDTDELAREAVRPPSPLLSDLSAAFGSAILQADGTLDRTQLRRIVFHDQSKREKLEALIHPVIRSLLRQRVAGIEQTYVIVAIPLLIEKQWHNEVDRILVVDCSESLQLQRAMERDGSDEATIRAIIGTQASRESRLEAADDIIHNDADLQSLRLQVEKLHRYYTSISTA